MSSRPSAGGRRGRALEPSSQPRGAGCGSTPLLSLSPWACGLRQMSVCSQLSPFCAQGPLLCCGDQACPLTQDGDLRETTGRVRVLSPGSGPGSAGRLQRGHSASLRLGGPVCGTAAVMLALPPALAVPVLQGARVEDAARRRRELLAKETPEPARRARCSGVWTQAGQLHLPSAPPGPASGPVACQVARTHSRTLLRPELGRRSLE